MRKIDATWKASPSSGDRIDGMPATIQDVKTTFSDHIAFEHRVGVGTDDGGHLPGSALTYTGVSTAIPSYKPDGLTALDAQDLGRLWYQTDTGLLMTLTAYSPVTWTPCSSGGGSGGGTNYLPYALVSGASGWNIDTGSSRWQFGSPAWDTSVVLAGKSGTTGNGGGSLKTTFTGTFDSAVDKLYSSTFFVDQSDVGQAWKIQFTAKFVSAASYTDDSLEVFLWDVPNSIEIATGVTLKAMSLQPQTIQAWVYPSTSQQYRLRIRPNQNVAANFQLNIADVTVAPQQILSVPAVGVWIPYTPTFQGFGTPSSVDFKYRRVGSNVEVKGKLTVGTSTGVEAQISLPPGLSSMPDVPVIDAVGVLAQSGATAASFYVLNEASKPYVTFGFQSAGAGALTKQNGNTLAGSGIAMSINFTVPVAQWSSSVQVSAEAVEYASNNDTTTGNTNGQPAGQINGAGNYGGFGAAWATGTNWVRRVKFKSPIRFGYDRLTVLQRSAGTGVENGDRWPRYNDINSGSIAYGILFTPVAGDPYSVDVTFCSGGAASGPTYGSAGQAWSAFSGVYQWIVQKVSGGSLAEVPPVVRAEYIGSDAAIAGNLINWGTKFEDTHNAVTTGANAWKFSAPVAGVYDVIATGIPTTANNNYYLKKNGANHRVALAAAAGNYNQLKFNVRLSAGEYISIINADGANNVAGNGYIIIIRIGS